MGLAELDYREGCPVDAALVSANDQATMQLRGWLGQLGWPIATVGVVERGRAPVQPTLFAYVASPPDPVVLDEALCEASRHTRRMREWLDGTRRSGDRLTGMLHDARLTRREMETMERVFEGSGDALIADALGISYGRVRQLIGSAFAKLGVQGRNELIGLLARRLRDEST